MPALEYRLRLDTGRWAFVRCPHACVLGAQCADCCASAGQERLRHRPSSGGAVGSQVCNSAERTLNHVWWFSGSVSGPAEPPLLLAAMCLSPSLGSITEICAASAANPQSRVVRFPTGSPGAAEPPSVREAQVR
jgi:hypothetical protein